MFIEKKDYQIPDIFNDEDVKSAYTHTNKIKCNRELLLYKLTRLNIVSQTNIKNRASLICEKDLIILKTTEEFQGEEKIQADVDQELYDFYVRIYVDNLLKIISLIDEEIIIIEITPDKENINTIVIKGENSNCTYVSVLSEYEENFE